MQPLFPDYDVMLAVMGMARHKDWDRESRSFLAVNRHCLVCGRTESLQCHHVYPFHRFPELEMVKLHWRPLCTGGPLNCHYLAGHAGRSWSHYSPNIALAVEQVRSMARLLKMGSN